VLKPDDLKNVESYKKAMKRDLAKVGSELTTKFFVYRDVEIPGSAGGKQKYPAFLALIDDKPIKSALKGKRLTCQGRCAISDGMIAFEADQGTVPYRQLKISLPAVLGKTVLIPAGEDDEAEDDGEEKDSAEKQPAAAAPAEHPAKAAPRAPKAPPKPPPPPPLKAGPRYAQLNAAWKKIVETARKRVAASPSERASLAKAMSGIPEMLSGGKLAEAQKRMTEVVAMLKAPPPPGAKNNGSLSADWNKLAQRIKEVTAANPKRKNELVDPARQILKLVQERNEKSARERMAAFAKLLDSMAPGSAASANGPVPPGLVKYRASLVQFARAKSVVAGQIDGLKQAIAARAPQEKSFAALLASHLSRLNIELAHAVDQAIQVAANPAAPVNDQVRTKLNQYLTSLASNPLVKQADSNPLGVEVSIAKTLGTAIHRIQNAMPR
jgi:hypothetical protein